MTSQKIASSRGQNFEKKMLGCGMTLIQQFDIRGNCSDKTLFFLDKSKNTIYAGSFADLLQCDKIDTKKSMLIFFDRMNEAFFLFRIKETLASTTPAAFYFGAA